MAFFVLAACGGGSSKHADASIDSPAPDAAPDPLDGAVSGSRIKIKWQVFPDGSKTFFSLHDTQLNTDCYPFNFYGDSKLYCIPNGIQPFYTDGSCHSPVALATPPTCATDATPPFIVEYASVSCIYGVSHVYRLGAQTTLASFYQFASGDVCVGPTAVTNQTAYAPGAELTTSDLAQLTLTAPTTDALGVRYLESGDGLKMPWTFHDSAGNFDCMGQATYKGATTARCTPTDTQNANFYGDSSCGQAETISFCNAPGYAVTQPKSGCPLDPSTYWSVNPTAVSTTTVYNWNASTQTCAMGSPPGTFAYQVGTALTVQSLMRETDTLPGRRLQPVHFIAGTQRIPDHQYLYDSMLGTECFTEQLQDGSVICLPNAHLMSSSAVFYSDAACTTIATVAPIYRSGPSGCMQPPNYKYVNRFTPTAPGQCAPTFELHALGAPYSGTIYTKTGTTCTASTATNITYYQMGAPLPAAGMATGMLQVDP